MLITKAVFSTSVLLAVALQVTPAWAAPDAYETAVKADNPIGYWRLNETSGTTAADLSGNRNNGTYSPAVTLGQPGLPLGVPGDKAVLFDGASATATGRVVVPNSATLNPPKITMEAKVRWDGPNDGIQQRILEKESYAGTTQYGLSILPDGHVLVELRMKVSGTTPTIVNAQSNDPVTQGVETHVVATYDGKVINIYLNDSIIKGVAKTVNANEIDIDTKWPHTPPDDPEVALAIGDRMGIIPPPPLHRTFNGLIDEVALFDKVLTQDQIRVHYQSQFKKPGGFQYAVKFVCGTSKGQVVAPGQYFTAINVHNPNEKDITFRRKFAVALPGEKPGPVSKFSDVKLGPDRALEIDCPDILSKTDTREGFLKGFVVIESALELDVVAVYTAAGATGRVETMELERVKPRRQGAEPQGQTGPDTGPRPEARLLQKARL